MATRRPPHSLCLWPKLYPLALPLTLPLTPSPGTLRVFDSRTSASPSKPMAAPVVALAETNTGAGAGGRGADAAADAAGGLAVLPALLVVTGAAAAVEVAGAG